MTNTERINERASGVIFDNTMAGHYHKVRSNQD